MSNSDAPRPGLPSSRRATIEEPVRAARAYVFDGVGPEIAASFPGITRLGGQIVAALYLAEGPLSMDDLSAMLGRSKSNVFANLRALEAAGIAVRHRASGARHDLFELRGGYPDVVVGAYLNRLRSVILDKVDLCARALTLLGDSEGAEAEALRARLGVLQRKYERFASATSELARLAEGPVDLEAILDALPEGLLSSLPLSSRSR